MSFDGLHAVRGAQEPREGVFGHQVVDSLLSVAECVGTRRTRHTQQSLPGLSVQVDLRGKRIIIRSSLNYRCVFIRITHAPMTLLDTDLLWSVRVDELAVDAAALGLLQVERSDPVVLTGQPELEVLLAEL